MILVIDCSTRDSWFLNRCGPLLFHFLIFDKGREIFCNFLLQKKLYSNNEITIIFGALFSASSSHRGFNFYLWLSLRVFFKRIHCACEWRMDQYLLQPLPPGGSYSSHHLFHFISNDWAICTFKLGDCYNNRELWVSLSQEWLSQQAIQPRKWEDSRAYDHQREDTLVSLQYSSQKVIKNNKRRRVGGWRRDRKDHWWKIYWRTS